MLPQMLLAGLLILPSSAPALADGFQPPPEGPPPAKIPTSAPGLRNEIGYHYGAPLRLSAHATRVFPWREDTVERIEGPELIAEAGLAGVRAGIGWARRGRTYYGGDSLTVTAVHTFETILDPLGFPSDHTLLALGYRIIALGLTLRGEGLYDLDARSGRWGLGWSVGLSW